MSDQKTRGVIMACTAAAALLALPSQSGACPLLDCLFGGGAQTTYSAPYAASTYAPAYTSASACSPCASQQTCSYVPQTSYRTAYRSVPVTTYRPVSSCNLCDFLCCSPPRTTYRPVTTLTYQAYMVPYTTYRMVCSDPCATTTLSAAPASCCTPATIAPLPTTTPTMPSGADVAPQTFDNGSQPADEAPLRAVPEPSGQTNPTSVPSLIDPGNNRVTQRPVRQAARFHLVASPPKTEPAPTVPVNDGGWRASSD